MIFFFKGMLHKVPLYERIIIQEIFRRDRVVANGASPIFLFFDIIAGKMKSVREK